jgi:hypothetical protein
LYCFVHFVHFGKAMFNLDHEELGQDGDRLEVDGESPEDLHQRELIAAVRNQGEDKGRTDQEFNPKWKNNLTKSKLD